MPQFDIFSFFSQLFWVFFSLSFLYLILCFFLLPALSITLKIRKRKLQNVSETDQSLISANQNDSSSLSLLESPLSTLSSTAQDNWSFVMTGTESNRFHMSTLKNFFKTLKVRATTDFKLDQVSRQIIWRSAPNSQYMRAFSIENSLTNLLSSFAATQHSKQKVIKNVQNISILVTGPKSV